MNSLVQKIMKPIIILFVMVMFGGCTKSTSKIPHINFISNSKQFMLQNGQDSTYLKFYFEDGDGDIGSDFDNNVMIKDARTGLILSQHRIPNYTDNTGNYRSGEVTLLLYSACCIYPNNTACISNLAFPTRTMEYIIQIKDEAGNYSNEIKTPKITLDCF